MLGRELEGRANKLVRESKERAEKARRQAEKERILKARQDERLRLHEEQQQQQRLQVAAAIESVRPLLRSCCQRSFLATTTSRRIRLCFNTGTPETRRGTGEK